LANIFLHQLDEFILKLKDEFYQGIRSKTTKEYKHICYLIGKNRNVKNILEVKRLSKIQKLMPAIDYYDPNYKRLNYVRYADD
jgi:hypothetical protein